MPPGQSGALVQRIGQGGLAGGELVRGDEADRPDGDGDVEHRGDEQGPDDGQRQVPGRLLGLLRGRRHRIEADVREEDHAGRGDGAMEAVRGERGEV